LWACILHFLRLGPEFSQDCWQHPCHTHSVQCSSEDDNDEKRFLEIDSCSTHVKCADILTKGLLNEKFEANRKLNQGW
jgi:hypothetical protein